MNVASARRLFNTTSLSYRTIGRPSRHVLVHPFRLRAGQFSTEAQPTQERPVNGSQVQDNHKPQAEGDNAGTLASTELSARLEAKEAEVVDLTGRLRYLQADFVNLQRNAAREKDQQRDYAITRFAGDLLEVVDVLSTALNSVPKSFLTPTSPEAPSGSSGSSAPSSPADPPQKSVQEYLTELHHGVDMTHRLLLTTLAQYGIKPFDPTGETFDPNRHEALYQAPIPGKQPGSVLACQKIGFMIKDRLLRAAQVGVVQDASSS